MEMNAYSFKTLVPEDKWVEMYPVITAFSPGHDARILSENTSLTSPNGAISIHLEFKFSQNMSCYDVTNGLTISSTTEVGVIPSIQASSVSCSPISPPESPKYIGALPSSWMWQGTLENVYDGVHQLTLSNIFNSRWHRFDKSMVPSFYQVLTDNSDHRSISPTSWKSHKSAGFSTHRQCQYLTPPPQ